MKGKIDDWFYLHCDSLAAIVLALFVVNTVILFYPLVLALYDKVERLHMNMTVGIPNHDVIPRRAYFDNRQVTDGLPGNRIVILAEFGRNIETNAIVGCEVDQSYSVTASVFYPSGVPNISPQFTHFAAIIHCYGHPESALKDGMKISVIYKNNNEHKIVKVEKNLYMPVKSTVANSIVVCAITTEFSDFNFKDWYFHLAAIKVDKIHLSGNNEILKSAYHYSAVTQGFLELDAWNMYASTLRMYDFETMLSQNCMMKHMHEFDFTFPTDLNHYLITDKGIKDIHLLLGDLFTPEIGLMNIPRLSVICNYMANMEEPKVTFVSVKNGAIYRLAALDIENGSILKEFEIGTVNDRKEACFLFYGPGQLQCSLS